MPRQIYQDQQDNNMRPNNQSQLPLSQALQSLLGGQAGQQADPTQLFNQLIANAGSGLKLNLPQDTSLHHLVLKNQHPVEAQATKQAIKNGADPAILNQAMQSLGKNAYIGLCEAFVEKMTQGKEGIYPSAGAAWQAQQHLAQKDWSKGKAGDSIYFAPDSSNGYNGHTGVLDGAGNMVSATYNGIKKTNINDWMKTTGQKALGYIPNDNRITQHRDQLYPKQPQPGTIANLGSRGL